MILSKITPAPPDAILGLTEAFKSDSRPNKINLGVGVYQDDTGVTPVMKSVKAAEEKILASEKTKSYLSISGAPEYKAHVQSLILGADHTVIRDGRVRTAHTPGGTGGLRVGAEFLEQIRPDASVWASNPTWANHPGIFAAAGFKMQTYPYYNPTTMGLDYEAMRDALKQVPAGDIVLLHVCCHNPTGVDLSEAQWKELGGIATAQGWIPFLDFAYQGLGDDLDRDRAGLLRLVDAVPELFVASSFSKNFGLYRERTGALTVVASDKDSATAAFSHVEKTIRVIYSNPPAHGGLIVSTILDDSALRSQWESEVVEVRDRIKSVRSSFVNELAARGVDRDFSFIEQQKGMFSFSGLTDDQVAWLREEKGIYIVKGGRINVAGITTKNIAYLCDSIAEALKR
jgi:aspartate/tyrosine/aromatic aminotransferase